MTEISEAMTEISEAAKRKARELALGHNFIECDAVDALARVLQEHSDAVDALARVLQEHSDAAKDCLNAPPFGPERKARLQSLILPDEPCPHETVFRYPPCKTFTCTKCGKALKIVEAGDV